MESSIATSQVVWLRRNLEDIAEKQEEALPLSCGSKLAIAMSKIHIFIAGQETLQSHTTSFEM